MYYGNAIVRYLVYLFTVRIINKQDHWVFQGNNSGSLQLQHPTALCHCDTGVFNGSFNLIY